MTERLADINARIDGIRQLGAVVNAIRGIAAARAQQARGQLATVDSYAAMIAVAVGQALVLAPPDRGRPGPVRRALVLFCAEQGFAGAFSERVLDTAGAELGHAALFLVGTRGAAIAAERGIAPRWTMAMPAHSNGIPKLADHIAEQLYADIAAGKIDRLDVVFSRRQPGGGIHVERHPLFPVDLTAFAHPSGLQPPLLNLAPGALLSDLTADYLHAQLCHAALHAFAGECEARMEAMAAARNQIEGRLSELQSTQRQVRQEEITAEIIELAAGETAGRMASS